MAVCFLQYLSAAVTLQANTAECLHRTESGPAIALLSNGRIELCTATVDRCTENCLFGHVVSEIYEQTNRHTESLTTILRTLPRSHKEFAQFGDYYLDYRKLIKHTLS